MGPFEVELGWIHRTILKLLLLTESTIERVNEFKMKLQTAL